MSVKYPKRSKQDTVGKKRHIPVTIPHRVEIIRRLESSES
jgi:hypothetical protein